MKAQVRYMYQVKSSQLKQVGYDAVNYYLAVEFKNLAVYGYSGVDHETYCRLLNAESIGVYFTDFIKDHHECEKLKDAPKKSGKKTVPPPKITKKTGFTKKKVTSKKAAPKVIKVPPKKPKKKAVAKKRTKK